MNGFLDSRKRKLQPLPAGCKRKLQLLPPGMRTVPVLTEQRLEPSLTLFPALGFAASATFEIEDEDD
jgi:hypothetical protein